MVAEYIVCRKFFC